MLSIIQGVETGGETQIYTKWLRCIRRSGSVCHNCKTRPFMFLSRLYRVENVLARKSMVTHTERSDVNGRRQISLTIFILAKGLQGYLKVQFV